MALGRKLVCVLGFRGSPLTCRMSNIYIKTYLLLLWGYVTVLLVSEHLEAFQAVPGFVLQLGPQTELDVGRAWGVRNLHQDVLVGGYRGACMHLHEQIYIFLPMKMKFLQEGSLFWVIFGSFWGIPFGVRFFLNVFPFGSFFLFVVNKVFIFSLFFLLVIVPRILSLINCLILSFLFTWLYFWFFLRDSNMFFFLFGLFILLQ